MTRALIRAALALLILSLTAPARAQDSVQEIPRGGLEATAHFGPASAPQVLRRSLAAIAPVVQRPEDAVCVIHGGVTAGLMMAWFGGGRYDYSVSPGQGFQVTFREGQPVSYTRIPAAE